MQSKATTVEAYLAELPEDRRATVEGIRRIIRKNLPRGYEEGMQYGMIGYYVPHRLYPPGYHCKPTEPLPFAGIGSQKNHVSMYLMCIYSHEATRQRFIDDWTATGRTLNMGAGCVRVKSMEDVAEDVLAETIRGIPVKAYIEFYEASFPAAAKRAANTAATKPAAKKPTVKKAAVKKSPAKKTTSKKTPAKKTTVKETPAKKTSARR